MMRHILACFSLQFFASDPAVGVKHTGGRNLAALEQFMKEQKGGPSEEEEKPEAKVTLETEYQT